MSDQIFIEGLTFIGRHGVFDHERRDGVRLKIDLTLHTDVRNAADHDRLSHTTDYAAVAQTVLEIGMGESFHLLEALAERICEVVLARHGPNQIDLTLRKLAPPLAAYADAVGIRLTRRAKG